MYFHAAPTGGNMDNPLLEGGDITSYLAEFVDDNQYLYFALVCRGWRTAWGRRRPAVTKALTTHSTGPQLLYSFECGLGRSAAVCDTAARLGRLDLLQIARARGCPFGLKTSANAAEEGHLAILKYLRRHGCPWNWTTYQAAARGGHRNILEWMCVNRTFAYFAMGAC